MQEDVERARRIRQEIASAGLDAALGQLSSHVLMMTGYAPVLGQSFVLFPASGEPTLVVPEAEASLARQGWCPDIRIYHVDALNSEDDFVDVVCPVLTTVAAERGLAAATIGFEGGSDMVPASYTQVAYPASGTLAMYHRAMPRAQFVDFTPIFKLLQSTKSPREVQRLRVAADIAALGVEAARERVRVGVGEPAVAAAAEAAIQAAGRAKGVERVLPFAHVMSGARSALAYQAFNLTSQRTIQAGDPVLLQLEVYADGYWAEVTRTFFAGDPGAEGRRIYAASLAAQALAFQAIHDGVAASDVDAAARDYLTADGFGPCFRHGLGHGVGFQAISPGQPPRLHPGSTDTLLTDMVFNVEPGVYVHGWGGVRINNTVVVTPRRADILTQIPSDLAWAIVPQRAYV